MIREGSIKKMDMGKCVSAKVILEGRLRRLVVNQRKLASEVKQQKDLLKKVYGRMHELVLERGK